MDDFGDDDFNTSAASGVDPAAEFLAREQDQLAGLEDDILAEGGVVGNSTAQSGQGFINDISSNTMGMNGGLNNVPAGRDYSSLPREEPEKIKKWREEQKIRLEAKDQEEEKKKTEMKEHARKELDDWYKHHKEAIEKTRSANRNAEKELVSQPTELEPGMEWERIAKLCDFNPKAGRNSKDVSRMRSIILQLKQTPPATNSTRH